MSRAPRYRVTSAGDGRLRAVQLSGEKAVILPVESPRELVPASRIGKNSILQSCSVSYKLLFKGSTFKTGKLGNLSPRDVRPCNPSRSQTVLLPADSDAPGCRGNVTPPPTKCMGGEGIYLSGGFIQALKRV